ncbi:unnamed protein product [Meganyctiphanes norvegica]|uniref:Matrix-remodeling-associated protein 7 helical domain-containing protein n=1 Tax=Meganyctiphanes norvegica TaxID=48144 RepID=A0AAV2Q8S4_MEGNR
MAGYTNSQTWEAWYESSQVLWNNTCMIFLMSVIMSIAAAVFTWRMPSHVNIDDHGDENLLQEEDLNKEKCTEQDNVGIPGKVKAAQQRALQDSIKLTDEQQQQEKRAEAEQLAAIYILMQQQGEKFGQTSMDDIKQQMKLYST